MKRLVGALSLAAVLTTGPAFAADAKATCRASLDGLAETMRKAPVYKDPAHEKARQALLRQTEKAIADGRKAGTDECALWRAVSTKAADF